MGTEEEPTWRVIEDYEAVYADRHARWRELRVGGSETEYDGWVWCIGQSGKSGWVSEAYIEQSGDVGVALRDYAATELSVRVGETLTIVGEESGWVWATNSRGRSGWVPAANVERFA